MRAAKPRRCPTATATLLVLVWPARPSVIQLLQPAVAAGGSKATACTMSGFRRWCGSVAMLVPGRQRIGGYEHNDCN
jgi:hypothetical protein